MPDGCGTGGRLTDASAHERKYHSLDGVRALSATAVVIYHSPAFFLPFAAPGAALALDLFFMISGFVVSIAYEHRFRAGMSTLAFMRIRLIRLYPLYVLGAGFATLVTVVSLLKGNIEHWDAMHLALSGALTFLILPNPRGWEAASLFPLNVPYWSLFYELLANFLFALFWGVLTTRRLVAICALSALALVLVIAQGGSIDEGSTASTVLPALVRVSFGFSAGVLLARLMRDVARYESNAAFLVIAGVTLMLLMARPQGPHGAYWDAVGALVVCPALVYCGIRFDPSSWLRSVVASLGIASYAVYVLHSPVSAVLHSATRLPLLQSDPMRGAPYVGMMEVLLLFVGGWVIDQVYDIPVRQWLSRMVPKSAATRRGVHA